MKKIIAGLLIGGASVAGIALGAGPASAKIDPGQYTSQQLIYGFIPTPQSNVRIVGNSYQTDYYGLGPQNLSVSTIVPTRDGGKVVGIPNEPVTEWLGHWEFHKTRDGYRGTNYIFGQIPIGDFILKKSPPRANMPR